MYQNLQSIPRVASHLFISRHPTKCKTLGGSNSSELGVFPLFQGGNEIYSSQAFSLYMICGGDFGFEIPHHQQFSRRQYWRTQPTMGTIRRNMHNGDLLFLWQSLAWKRIGLGRLQIHGQQGHTQQHQPHNAAGGFAQAWFRCWRGVIHCEKNSVRV